MLAKSSKGKRVTETANVRRQRTAQIGGTHAIMKYLYDTEVSSSPMVRSLQQGPSKCMGINLKSLKKRANQIIFEHTILEMKRSDWQNDILKHALFRRLYSAYSVPAGCSCLGMKRQDEGGLWDKRSLSRPIPNPRRKSTVAQNKGIDEITAHLDPKLI